MAQPTSAGVDARWASALELARSAPQELSVADLADLVGYSPFHFTRLFTQRTGIGPGQYLIAQRIDAAKRLLLTEDLPVIDVATAVGFDSVSSFSRRFKHTVGVAPGALRQLADRVADHPPQPFALLPPSPDVVRVHLDVPEEACRRGVPSLWVGRRYRACAAPSASRADPFAHTSLTCSSLRTAGSDIPPVTPPP